MSNFSICRSHGGTSAERPSIRRVGSPSAQMSEIRIYIRIRMCSYLYFVPFRLCTRAPVAHLLHTRVHTRPRHTRTYRRTHTHTHTSRGSSMQPREQRVTWCTRPSSRTLSVTAGAAGQRTPSVCVCVCVWGGRRRLHQYAASESSLQAVDPGYTAHPRGKWTDRHKNN